MEKITRILWAMILILVIVLAVSFMAKKKPITFDNQIQPAFIVA